jgi:hypothetical protein
VNARSQLLCLWCAPLVVLTLAVGWALLAQFFPPHDPTWTAQKVAAVYAAHRGGIRVGMVLAMVSGVFFAFWSAVVIVQVKRIEGRFAVMAYVQTLCAAAGLVFFMVPPMIWTAAAFRESQDPGVVRALNDLGWMLYMLGIVPFLGWCLAFAIAVLSDTGDDHVFPRWVGYLSIWAAVGMVPTLFVGCFKTGPLAWNGLLAFYVSVAAFFTWFCALTVVLFKVVKGQARAAAAAHVADGVEVAKTAGTIA